MASITIRPTTESRNEKVGIDWWLVLAAALLTAIGLASIFSSGYGDSLKEFKKQIINIIVGCVPMAVFGFCHPRLWSKFANVIYLLNLFLLVCVLVLGHSKNGAERWIGIGGFEFQPSELSKIFIVLTLASFYAARQDQIKSFATFALGALHVFVPVALILKQPHLGASLLLLTVWVAMSLVAGVSPKYMFLMIGTFVVLTTLIFKVPTVRNHLIKPYQWERIMGLLGQETGSKKISDMKYQTDVASYAFANGGIAGTGYLKGEIKRRVPFVSTDFIWSLVGEEFGLLGCITILGIFALLFYRIWLGMLNAADLYYQLIMGGILTVLGFHTIVNAGMVMGVFPVVGLWAPFLSYGGSAIWLCMSLVGLSLNIRSKERAVLF